MSGCHGVEVRAMDMNSNSRIACVQLPHFFWQMASQENRLLANVPVIVASNTPGHPDRTVIDTSPLLTGVLRGMPIEQARSRSPEAVVIDADIPTAETLFDKVLDALEQIGPDVEPSEPGTAYISINGLERLYGGDPRLVEVIATAIRNIADFDMRIGIGPSKWLAYVAAVYSQPGKAYKLTRASQKFLESLPVTLLPIEPKTIIRMDEFGLTQLGHISSKPRGAVHTQFGSDGALAWDLANGIDRSPLVPRQFIPTVSEYLELPDATVNLINIVSGIESLLARAFSRPLLRNRHARRCAIQAQVFESVPWIFEVAFKEPVGSKSDALFAVKTKLDTLTVPGPLEDLRITLSGLTAESGRQESMWLDVKRQDDLWQAISQLEERIGEPPPIYRVQTMKSDSKVPEWRSALVQLSH
jgi:DNA polymerase-4